MISISNKYFVTGASGFIGRCVCDLLVSSGFEVCSVVRRPDSYLQRLGVKVFVGDLWDAALLSNAISGSAVIIHCAGNARFGNGPNYYKDNVDVTDHILRVALKNAPSAKFIFISTIGAIDRAPNDPCIKPLNELTAPHPNSDYGLSKLLAEGIVKNSGMEYSIIRPSMVIGSGMRFDSHFAVFARQSFKLHPFSLINWPGVFSIIDVKDLARAILFVSSDKRTSGETFFCAGDSISIKDFFKQSNPSFMRLSLPQISYVARRLIRWIPFSLKALLLPALTASDNKLRSLGWQTTISLKDSLDEVIRREKCRVNPNISPRGQTVITGAASGLGRALTIYLSTRRDSLLLIDKDYEALHQLSSQIQNCKINVTDLSDPNAVNMLLASDEWMASEITELYACAGLGLRGKMQDISFENHRKIIEVNVLARVALARDVISRMQRRYFGRVIMISSSSAFQALPYMATYAASNSALLSIAEAWSREVSADGLQIMAVCPGGMRTNFQKMGGVREIDGEKLMLPEEVVTEIISGLRKRKVTLIVSFRSFAMSILARILPRAWSNKLWEHLMERLR